MFSVIIAVASIAVAVSVVAWLFVIAVRVLRGPYLVRVGDERWAVMRLGALGRQYMDAEGDPYWWSESFVYKYCLFESRSEALDEYRNRVIQKIERIR